VRKLIGFIGAGNMAQAIIRGMISSDINPASIYIHRRNLDKLSFAKDLNINICTSNLQVVNDSKYIFIAVKPNMYNHVLREISPYLNDNHIIITMAAGYEIKQVKEVIGNLKVVRTMPNTPALVGEGFTAVCFDDLITEGEKNEMLSMLETFGSCQVISESYINSYSAITGSGPAFYFMIMEAMADAAVLLGIPRSDAYKAVESTMLGSAKLALETRLHPGELKDMVCSPGGTTIEGIRTLEEKGLRSSIIECITNTYKKNIDITKIR
jgi:pyrroline-5-carboxylate reductase